jgi:hypothetical protein
MDQRTAFTQPTINDGDTNIKLKNNLGRRSAGKSDRPNAPGRLQGIGGPRPHATSDFVEKNYVPFSQSGDSVVHSQGASTLGFQSNSSEPGSKPAIGSIDGSAARRG